mgnify:CR=1 FL=1
MGFIEMENIENVLRRFTLTIDERGVCLEVEEVVKAVNDGR